MKMKKIISLAVCAMMALSTVANAAYIVDEGWYVADKVTKAEVEARQPKATIKVTEKTAAEAKEAGLPMGRGASALTDANSDFYQIDLTMSNLGDLMYAYLAGTDFGKEMQVRVFNAQVQLPNVEFKKIATTSKFNGVDWTTSDAGNEDKLLSMLWYAGSDINAYPMRTPTTGDLEGTYIENAAIDTATFVFAVEDGAKYENIVPKVQVTYAGVNDDETFSADATGAGNTVSIAPISKVKLSKVEITSTATEVVDGQTLALTAKAVNDDNSENKTATLAWDSSDKEVATVEGGVVKALKPGKTTISVTATDGAITTPAAEVEITVTAKPVVNPVITINGATGFVDGVAVTAGTEKGFVWTPVVISNYNSKAGTYTATFKADGVTPDKTAVLNGMPAIEGNPTVTFAIILRTNNTGVKLGIDFAE